MARENLRGIAAISAAMAFLVGNDMLLKLASPNLPFGQLIFLRGVVATGLILIACALTGTWKHWRQIAAWPVVGRSLANTASTFLYIQALFHLPLANVTSIMQATPLLLTALAAVVLREGVGWRRWTAIAVGFFGVLLIVRPDAGGFSVYALFALFAIFFVAARDLMTRVVQAHIPSLIVTLATALAVTLGAAIYSLFEGWADVPPATLILVCASATCLVCGYHLLIVAFRMGEIAVVSPFRFTIVLYALLGGYLVWNEIPDRFTFAGIGLIVIMGAYTFHRERLRSRTEPPLVADTRREI